MYYIVPFIQLMINVYLACILMWDNDQNLSLKDFQINYMEVIQNCVFSSVCFINMYCLYRIDFVVSLLN